MSKNNIITILVVYSLILIAGIINFGMMHERSIEQVEKQENKIEVLQEENASLHDDVWHLNQELMNKDTEE